MEVKVKTFDGFSAGSAIERLIKLQEECGYTHLSTTEQDDGSIVVLFDDPDEVVIPISEKNNPLGPSS